MVAQFFSSGFSKIIFKQFNLWQWPSTLSGKRTTGIIALTVAALLSFAAPAQAEWEWVSPSPVGYDIKAVWGSSSADVWAVGDWGTVVHTTDSGANWTKVNIGTGKNLTAIWGTSASDIYAGGDSGTLYHYNGTSWSVMSSLASATATFTAIWGSSATDVYFFAGRLYHYDGTSWTIVNDDGGTPIGGYSVWGSSATDIYAGGGVGSLYHYNGTAWSYITETALPSYAGTDGDGNSITIYWLGTLSDITGTSASDVYISAGAGSILHYDGTSWTDIGALGALEAGTTTIDMVLAVSSTEAYAATNYSFYKWDGATWTLSSTAPAWTGLLYGGWTDGTTHYVAGNYGHINKWSGAAWSESSTTITTSHLYAIWLNSDTDMAIADSQANVNFYDGTSWTQTSVPCCNARFQGLWGTANNDLFAVESKYGNIYHWDGAAWSKQTITGLYLVDVWGTSANNVYAIGLAGTIMHTTNGGTNWSVETSCGSTPDLYSVWGNDANDVYVVGEGGVVCHSTDQSTWSIVTSGTTEDLRKVFGSSATDIYWVGNEGAVMSFNGTTATSVGAASGLSISNIWGVSGSAIYGTTNVNATSTVAAYSSVMMFDGTSWGLMDIRVGGYTIAGLAADNVYMAGPTGTLLNYTGDTNAPVTTTSPTPGTYTDTPDIHVYSSCYDNSGSGCATTYYTMDGTTVTTSSSEVVDDYFGKLSFVAGGVTTIQTMSVDNAGNEETAVTHTFNLVDSTPPVTTPEPAGADFELGSAFEVRLRCEDSVSGCDKTYYTNDGTDPTTESSHFTYGVDDDTLVSINETGITELKFYSTDIYGNAETVQTETYDAGAGVVDDGTGDDGTGADGTTDIISGGGGGGGGDGGGGGCFIATAAYGSYLDSHVMVLREFRDNFLLTNRPGTEFVNLYYEYSPPIADFIAEHKALKIATRVALTPLLFGLEYPLHAGIIFLLLGSGVGAFAVTRRVRES